MKPSTARSRDWSDGGDGLVFQQCADCGARWYFERRHCPGCGGTDLATRASTGHGTVVATTTIHRAPDPAWRAAAPYTVVLVDLDDGFRAMGHGPGTLAIGDRVTTSITTIAGQRLPWFAA